ALDGLPLALDQAGAYIEESGCNLSDYLNRYQAGRLKLLHKRGSFDFDHPASVTDTFSYSLDKIEKISRTAVELIRFGRCLLGTRQIEPCRGTLQRSCAG